MLREDVLTIAQGGTDSNIVDLQGRTLVRAIVPDCTGTLTVYMGRAAATMLAAKDNGGTALAFPDNGVVSFDPLVPGVRFFQVKSGSAEAAVRTIYLYSMDLGG